MQRKNKNPFGSQRTSYFREAPRISPTKHRSQRVRVRRRYATSVMESLGRRLWRLIQVTLVLGFFIVGGYYGHQFWTTSPYLKIQAVELSAIPPAGFAEVVSVQTWPNILTLKVGELERAALDRFQELKSITIRRTLKRNVRIAFVYREPMAFLQNQFRVMGVDADGVVFPLTENRAWPEDVPMVQGLVDGPELIEVMASLRQMQTSVPAFYDLIKFIKTDRIQPLHVVLQNDVVVHWGAMIPTAAATRAQRVIKIFEGFEPQKDASLRFVTDDRVVMNAKWKPKL